MNYETLVREKAEALKTKEKVNILAFESSCDETSVAVVESGRVVRSLRIASQIDTHVEYGGVVPEIASRMHVEAISGLTELALKDAGMTYDKLIAAGGGANGSVWRQIQADMFGVPVYTNAVAEEACFGACICAMVGDGLYPDIPTACNALVRTDGAPTVPIAENTQFYRSQLNKFAKLYEISSPLF